MSIVRLPFCKYDVVVITASRKLLVVKEAGEFTLPRASVKDGARPAGEIFATLRARWGLTVFVIATHRSDLEPEGFAIAECLEQNPSSKLVAIEPSHLPEGKLQGDCRIAFENVCHRRSPSPVSHLGWCASAIVWVERMTSQSLAGQSAIRQFHGGEGFALLRLTMNDGKHYWLKATGYPNEHELGITALLSQKCPEFLPSIVASRKDWNAWLMHDAGESYSDEMPLTAVHQAARSLASLQVRSVNWAAQLLNFGATDQRVSILCAHVDQIITYLIEAMERQVSTKSSPLTRDRLRKLGSLLIETCARVEDLGIPDSVLHGDLNPGNILFDGERCTFTDWSETAIGQPFSSFDRFAAWIRPNAASVSAYIDPWLDLLSQPVIDRALALTPFLTIYAHLYATGGWDANKQARRSSEGYSRSLARNLDREARNPRLLEVLGRC